MGENADRARVQHTSIDRFEQRRTAKHLELIQRYAQDGPEEFEGSRGGKASETPGAMRASTEKDRRKVAGRRGVFATVFRSHLT